MSSATPRELEELQTEFERHHCIRLPHLLDDELLDLVQRELKGAEFDEMLHAGIGLELCMKPNLLLKVLLLVTNNSRLFDLVRSLSACGPIGCFTGRVYRVVAGKGHYDSWHTDAFDDRMVGMSLNLSRLGYEGGVFQLREGESEQILVEAPNTGAGDALLFRIAPELSHRITPVRGTTSKTAFAGWFRSKPAFLELFVR